MPASDPSQQIRQGAQQAADVVQPILQALQGIAHPPPPAPPPPPGPSLGLVLLVGVGVVGVVGAGMYVLGKSQR